MNVRLNTTVPFELVIHKFASISNAITNYLVLRLKSLFMFTLVLLGLDMTFLIQLHLRWLKGFIKRENSHVFKTYSRHECKSG